MRMRCRIAAIPTHLALGWRLTIIAIATFLGYCESAARSFSTTMKRLLVSLFDDRFRPGSRASKASFVTSAEGSKDEISGWPLYARFAPQSGNWKGTPISPSTIFSENRYTLFRIMLQETALISNPSRPTRAREGW